MRRVWLLAAAAAAYLLAAWMVAPGFYDGFAPAQPYNWLCPPFLVAANQPPKSGSLQIKIIGGVPPPQLGAFIREIIQGGPVVGPPTLQRFFTVHVFVFPAIIVLLMYVHFRFIRAHGISEPM